MVQENVQRRCVVVYDGECRFCLAQMERIRSMDRRQQFEYRAAQDSGVIERFPQLAHADLNEGLRLIEPGGRVMVGADAVYEIARRLPVTGWLAPLYRVPPLRWAAGKIYRVIARNRFRLKGRCDEHSCSRD